MADPTQQAPRAFSKEEMKDYIDFLDTAQKDAVSLMRDVVKLSREWAPKSEQESLNKVGEVILLAKNELNLLQSRAEFQLLKMHGDVE